MDSHVILKFQHVWEISGSLYDTATEHLKVLTQRGSVWWGTGRTGISQDRAQSLRVQIEAGIPTYAFLYAFNVPRSVHPDKNLWYRARIKSISVGRPQNAQSIPSYYRSLDCAAYFEFSEITPVEFDAGTTPLVPGQAAIRHVGCVGNPSPELLVSLSNPAQKVPTLRNDDHPEEPVSEHLTGTEHTENSGRNLVLANRVIDLQDEVIQLQNEVRSLQTYREFYNKILTADYLFSSEKFFETWIIENIHKILPEIDIIERQPVAAWSDGKFGRLDLLAINKETKDLVIVEVKTRKRSSSSGYDQYLRYTSWAKKNRTQLAAKYKARGLQPSERPSFVIITDYADEEMKSICSDHGIQLILLVGGIGFERAA